MLSARLPKNFWLIQIKRLREDVACIEKVNMVNWTLTITPHESRPVSRLIQSFQRCVRARKATVRSLVRMGHAIDVISRQSKNGRITFTGIAVLGRCPLESCC